MIYVECKPDIALVEAVTGLRRRDMVHELQGKGAICRRLKRRSNCKAMIDEDPWAVQPSYIETLTALRHIPEHGLKLLHDKANNNFLIVLCQRLEEWILRTATQAHIDVRRYKLPNRPDKLHHEINLVLDRFEGLLSQLKGCDNFEALKALFE